MGWKMGSHTCVFPGRGRGVHFVLPSGQRSLTAWPNRTALDAGAVPPRQQLGQVSHRSRRKFGARRQNRRLAAADPFMCTRLARW